MSRKHLSCQSTRHTLSSHDLTSNVCRTGQTANQIPEPSHCIFLIECRAAIAWLCRVPDTNEEQGKREVHLYCAVHCNPSSLLRFYFCFFFFHFIIAVSHSASACLIAIYWCCVPLVFLCAPFAILRIIIAVCVYLCRTVDLLNDRCGTTKAHERRNDKKQNKNNQRHKHTSPMAINISSVSLFSLSCAIGNQQRNFCAETFTYKTYLFILLLFIHVWWLCLSW